MFKSGPNMVISGKRLGHKVKTQKHLVYTLEVKLSFQISWKTCHNVYLDDI